MELDGLSHGAAAGGALGGGHPGLHVAHAHALALGDALQSRLELQDRKGVIQEVRQWVCLTVVRTGFGRFKICSGQFEAGFAMLSCYETMRFRCESSTKQTGRKVYEKHSVQCSLPKTTV